MKRLITSIHQFGKKINGMAEHFAFCHPNITFAALFVGLPVGILTIVTVSTAVVALPMAFLMGCTW